MLKKNYSGPRVLTTEKRLFGEQVNDAVLLLLMGFTHARGTTTKCFAFLFYLRRVDLVAHPPGTRSISYLLFRKKRTSTYRATSGRAADCRADDTVAVSFNKKKIFCSISFFSFLRLGPIDWESFLLRVSLEKLYEINITKLER